MWLHECALIKKIKEKYDPRICKLFSDWNTHYCSAWRLMHIMASSNLPVPLTCARLNSNDSAWQFGEDRSTNKSFVFHGQYKHSFELIMSFDIKQKNRIAIDMLSDFYHLQPAIIDTAALSLFLKRVSSEGWMSGQELTRTVKYFNKSLLILFIICIWFYRQLFKMCIYFCQIILNYRYSFSPMLDLSVKICIGTKC